MAKLKNKNGKQKVQSSSPFKKPPKYKQLAIFPIGFFAILLTTTFAFGAFVVWYKSANQNIVNNNLNLIPASPVSQSPLPSYLSSNPSREYVHAGGKLLATNEAEQAAPTDLAVWRPSNGTWYVMDSQNGTQTGVQFGMNQDVPAPGDFDGDEKTDFCVFRPSTGTWHIMFSSTNQYQSISWGLSADKPTIADYDGDGRSDVAVTRTGANGNLEWHILRSSDNQPQSSQYGFNTDVTVQADYDGDAKADYAVYRASNLTWYIKRSLDGSIQSVQFGESGDVPRIGDYDGDGRYDFAVWRVGTQWRIKHNISGQVITYDWNYQAADFAVQGDYDADGKTDVAVWRESNGTWYIRKSSNGQMRIEVWGGVGDIPVPAPYRR